MRNTYREQPREESCAAVRTILERRKSGDAKCQTQTSLAKATGLSQTIWSAYLRGKKIPAKGTRKRIERKLGIAAAAWDRASIGSSNGSNTDKVLTESHAVTNSASEGGFHVDRDPAFSQLPTEAP